MVLHPFLIILRKYLVKKIPKHRLAFFGLGYIAHAVACLWAEEYLLFRGTAVIAFPSHFDGYEIVRLTVYKEYRDFGFGKMLSCIDIRK